MSDDAEETYVSGSELARQIGVDEKMVRKYRDSGLISRIARGPNQGLYPLKASKHAIEVGRDPDAHLKGLAAKEAMGGGDAVPDGSATNGSSGNLLVRARAANAVMQAERQKLELRKAKGEVIARADVEAAIRTAQQVVIDRLEGLPGLLAARVMQAPSVAAGEAIIREVVRELRHELAQIGEAIPNAA